MANFTRRAIRESFQKLLRERPLSRITVRDIVEDCGVNRNTFYYYYEGIPELLEELVTEEAEKLARDYPDLENMEDCLRAMVDSALERKREMLHIYNSVNREIYEHYLWRVCTHVINSYMNNLLRDRKISQEDRSLICRYLICLAFGLVSSWMTEGMPGDTRDVLERIGRNIRGMVEEMISGLDPIK